MRRPRGAPPSPPPGPTEADIARMFDGAGDACIVSAAKVQVQILAAGRAARMGDTDEARLCLDAAEMMIEELRRDHLDKIDGKDESK